ncbi:hypothetical protein [Halorubellus litoreus]|uniref:Uncharacterized protein n=1 Tax=Halorubellus litoreus TaxID=755308 RepID=A0ABD5VFZ9_9EURY
MSDNNTETETGKSRSKVRELALRGSSYREKREFSIGGEDVELVLKPLIDDDFYALLFRLDVTEDDMEEAMEEMDEQAEENDGEVDMDSMDPEMIAVLQDAAVMGVDAEAIGETEDGWAELVHEHLVGGISIEIGSAVMELSHAMGDAEKFRR